MARLEIVSSYCDGPCGGNPIEGDHYSEWVLTRSDRVQRVLDLCDGCAETLSILFERGMAPSERHRASKPVVPGQFSTLADWRDALDKARTPTVVPAPVGMTVRAA